MRARRVKLGLGRGEGVGSVWYDIFRIYFGNRSGPKSEIDSLLRRMIPQQLGIPRLEIVHKNSRYVKVSSYKYNCALMTITIKQGQSNNQGRKFLRLNTSSGSILYSFDISNHISITIYHKLYKQGIFTIVINTIEGEEYTLLFKVRRRRRRKGKEKRAARS